jgi:hypothetical protein
VRGRLLFEYRPPAVHPIAYAGALVFSVVFAIGALEVWVRAAPLTLLAWYALPLLLALWWWSAFARGPTRIYMHGIAPARPRVVRATRARPAFVHWRALAAVYPSFYDVTGAFVSPFASSDGKVTQMGLALEWPDGRKETVQFTPTRFAMWQPESAGYQGALAAVRAAFADRPLVPQADTFSDDEAQRMISEAGRPFLPFFAIVLLFASAAPILWILAHVVHAPLAVALPLALVAPIGVSVRSHVQSRRRNDLLDRLSKAAEHQRGHAVRLARDRLGRDRDEVPNTRVGAEAA